eukprot:Pgem_evm1s1320
MDVDGTNTPVTRQKALNNHQRGESVALRLERRCCSRCGRQSPRVAFCKVCKRYLCINEVNNNTTSRIRKSVETEPALVHSAKIHYVNSCFLLEHGDNKEGGAIYEHIKSFTFVQ